MKIFIPIYYIPTCAKTEQDPADVPKRVTDPGSPPKCSMFPWTHRRAATWSKNAQFPRACSSPVLKGKQHEPLLRNSNNTTLKSISTFYILSKVSYLALTYSPARSHLSPWLASTLCSPLHRWIPGLYSTWVFALHTRGWKQGPEQTSHPNKPNYDLIAGCNHTTMQVECTDISWCSEALMWVNYVHLNHCNSGKLIQKFSRFSKQNYPCFKHDSKYLVKSEIGDLTWRIQGVPVGTELLPPQHSHRLTVQSHHT